MAKDDRKRATREKILDAAVQQFGRHGFDKATVKAIADLASVGTGTVHWHFGTKVGLYAEAVNVAADQFIAVMRHYNGASETFSSLAHCWITRFRGGTGTSRMLRALAGDHRHHAMADAARRVNERFVDFWCDWLRDRQGAPQRRTEAPDAVLGTLIVAVLTGLVATDQSHGDGLFAVLESLARWIGTSEANGMAPPIRP